MKTVIHITENEACELIAEALAARAKKPTLKYVVTAEVTGSSEDGPGRYSPAHVRFEAEEKS